MQRFVEKCRLALSHLSVIQLSYNDFAAFYAPVMVVVALAIIPALFILGIRADWWVLNGILGATTSNPDTAWWLSLTFAAIIALSVAISTFMGVSIVQQKLHKKQMIGKDGATEDNPHWRHHRQQLRAFRVIGLLGFAITIALSLRTEAPAKLEAKSTRVALLESQNKRRAILDHRQKIERRQILEAFKSDSTNVIDAYQDAYKAKAGRNGTKLESSEIELARHKKELSQKGTSADRKKELKGRIAELENILIPRYKGNVTIQTRKAVQDKNDQLTAAREIKNTQLLALSKKYLSQDTAQQKVFLAESNGLAESIALTAFSTQGYNVIINILLALFVRGLAKYFGGATFGAQPLEFDELFAQQQRNSRRIPKQSNKGASGKKQRSRNGSTVVATRVSDTMTIAQLEAAKKSFESNYRAHKSKWNKKKKLPDSEKNRLSIARSEQNMDKWLNEIRKVENLISDKNNKEQIEGRIQGNLKIATA